MNKTLILILIIFGQSVYSQDYYIEEVRYNEDSLDLILRNSFDNSENNCFFKASVVYPKMSYYYDAKENIVYFLGLSFVSVGVNGKLPVRYEYQKISIKNCLIVDSIKFEKVETRENYIDYEITKDGYLIKTKDNIVFEKIEVSKILSSAIF